MSPGSNWNHHDTSLNTCTTCRSQGEVVKRILIVDDFQPARIVLRECLEMYGFSCQEAENGSEGLQAIQTRKFDLVISDNTMPIMTGLQMLQKLAETQHDELPPVIILTGTLTDQLYQEALNAGAIAVLQKPALGEDLISQITRILEPQ